MREYLLLLNEAEHKLSVYFDPQLDVYLAGVMLEYQNKLPLQPLSKYFLEERFREVGDSGLLLCTLMYPAKSLVSRDYYLNLAIAAYSELVEKPFDLYDTITNSIDKIVPVLLAIGRKDIALKQ